MAASAQVAGTSAKRAWLARLGRRAPVAPATSASTESRQIYILPTRAGLGYAAVLLAMLLGSLNYQNNLALFLTFVMISAAVVSMHHCWFHLLKLRVNAGDGAAVFRGQTALFPLRIEERGGRARSAICVDGGACVDIPALGHAALQVRRPAPRRGELALAAIDLETRYPFGLFRAWTRLPLQAKVLVYPTPAVRAPAPASVDASAQRGKRNLGTAATIISDRETINAATRRNGWIGRRWRASEVWWSSSSAAIVRLGCCSIGARSGPRTRRRGSPCWLGRCSMPTSAD
jgi:hypothetical protein